MPLLPNILKPLAPDPCAGGWELMGPIALKPRPDIECHLWWHAETKVQVLSSLEVVDDGHGNTEPQYHVSMARRVSNSVVHRVPAGEARRLLQDWGEGFEEDNHVPGGKVRNFWRPVNENRIGIECPCKEHEPAIVEDRGDYTWRSAG